MKRLDSPLIRSLLATLLLSPLAVASCSSEDPPKPGYQFPQVCQEIIDACHYKDDGLGGRIADCHTAGHDGDETGCEAAIADGCLQDCKDAPHINQDSGTPEAATDAMPDASGSVDAPSSTADAGVDSGAADATADAEGGAPDGGAAEAAP